MYPAGAGVVRIDRGIVFWKHQGIGPPIPSSVQSLDLAPVIQQGHGMGVGIMAFGRECLLEL